MAKACSEGHMFKAWPIRNLCSPGQHVDMHAYYEPGVAFPMWGLPMRNSYAISGIERVEGCTDILGDNVLII